MGVRRAAMQPLLPSGGGRSLRVLPARLATGVLALATVTLVGVVSLSGGARRTALDMTSVGVNCDGSVDITTLATGVPCPAGIVPTTMSYTSYAPYVLPPAQAPQILAPPPQAWGAAPVPVGPNAYQYATVWDGDHVLSGGQPEWAAEDAAQHALNLDNWRIKILGAKKEQARLSGEIQKISSGNTGSRRWADPQPGAQLDANKRSAQLHQAGGESSADAKAINDIRKSVATLAGQTTKALAALSREVDREGMRTPAERRDTQALRHSTDLKLDSIMKDLKDVTYHNKKDAQYKSRQRGVMLADVTTNDFPNAHVARWEHPPADGHTGDLGDGTWGGTNPALPWDWKGAQMGLDHGVMDNVLPDPDKYVWTKPSVPVDPTEYQKEWLGDVINIY